MKKPIGALFGAAVPFEGGQSKNRISIPFDQRYTAYGMEQILGVIRGFRL